MPSPLNPVFFERLVDWQRRAGRHGLPWQGSRDPYRVWLSEIMLQQTQVSTVLDYFPRFLARFPNVVTLAAAQEDEVLSLWSGLGYYSRARNLHRCAQVVQSQWGGNFPDSAEQLQTLPGIGRSTAAAIAAFCHGERISILDGNVRRVLTRVLAFGDDLAQTAAEQRLWRVAQGLLPEAPTADDMVAYTQGLMDLGATVCRRTRPDCEACPVAALCQARAQGQAQAYPVKTRRVLRRTEPWWLLWWRRSDGAYWLQRRPGTGIWAGLYAPPVLAQVPPFMANATIHPVQRHALTHRDLLLHMVEQPCTVDAPETAPGCWVHQRAQLDALGLPAPVRQWLLDRLPA
jgi:A/G-specific adenine glycosylase